ncbi:uncharacterized protein MEPE_05595 [Melanopsichium pennsylvanicum]|uniref:Uncharacterized protein n=2 Tax=Melanopsichium pennsylvanicum TaxID=63383 RepID=A0AAJ4XS58_9BASI|nr:conserved hypothetical protein [Melanopsichium pennsylvanicum 4]SNX86886.1 uncharacterized protein MEPE_05595 [Melanopsichium pennsylvanicum]
MKTGSIFSLLAIASAVLLGLTSATPVPAPQDQALREDGHSSVVLRLNNNRRAHCHISLSPSGTRAEIVSSKLVASGKISCKNNSDENPRVKVCDLGQQATEDEGTQTLKDACDGHNGKFQVM